MSRSGSSEVGAARPHGGPVRLDPDDEPVAELAGRAPRPGRGRPAPPSRAPPAPRPARAARRPGPRFGRRRSPARAPPVRLTARRTSPFADLPRAREIDVDDVQPRARRRPRTPPRPPTDRRRTPPPATSADPVTWTSRPPATSSAGMTSKGMGPNATRWARATPDAGITTTSSGSSGARRTASVPSRTRSSDSRPAPGSTRKVPTSSGRTPWDDWYRTRTGDEPLCAASSSLSFAIAVPVQLCAVRSTTSRPAGGLGRPPSPRSGSVISTARSCSSRGRAGRRAP